MSGINTLLAGASVKIVDKPPYSDDETTTLVFEDHVVTMLTSDCFEVREALGGEPTNLELFEAMYSNDWRWDLELFRARHLRGIIYFVPK